MKYYIYHKSILISIQLILLSLSLTSFLNAENMYTLPNIVVTDSHIKEKTCFTKTVIKVDSKKLEEKTLPEILENTPGIHVTTLAGRGSYSVVSIRGSTSSQVLVYIDGILVNGGGNSSVDLSAIPIDEIDTIEVYRGNVPAKFGRGGIGGVINIKTKKNIKNRYNFSASTGSWKFYKLEGNLKFNTLFVNGAIEGRTGDYPYLNDANTPFNLKDDYHAKRQNNYYNKKNFLVNYKLPIKENIISTTFRHFYKYRDLPGAAPGRDKKGTLTDAVIKTENNHIDMSYSFMINDGVVSVQPYYEKELKNFYNPKYRLGIYGLLKSRYNSYKYGMNISYELNLNDLVNIGFYNENRVERLKSHFTPLSNWLQDRNFQRNEYDFALQNNFKFFNRILTITPVVRKNILKDKDRKVKENDFYSKNSYSIGAKLFPPFFKNFYLKLNYGHFVRFPNFYEKFGDGATVIPNSNLTYERSKNLDYGFGLKRKFFNFDLTFFHNKIKNLIEFIMVNERYAMYKNIENANIKGIEANIGFNIYNIFIISANYTKLNAYSEQQGYKKNKPLPNRPAHKTFVRVQTNLKKFTTWVEYNEIGKNYFDDGGHYYYNSYDFINAGLVFKFKKNLIIALTIKNILNNQDMYAYANGFNVPKLPYYPVEGRHFYFKINYSF